MPFKQPWGFHSHAHGLQSLNSHSPTAPKKRGKISKNYRKLNSPEQPLAVELGSCGGPSHVHSGVREDGRLVSPKQERLRKLQEATTPLLPQSAKHQSSQLGLSWQSTSGSSSISSRSRSGWSRCSSSRRRRHRMHRRGEGGTTSNLYNVVAKLPALTRTALQGLFSRPLEDYCKGIIFNQFLSVEGAVSGGGSLILKTSSDAER